MHAELNQISTFENIFDLSENTSSIVHNGQEIGVQWLKGYQSLYTLYQSRYALLDEKILIVVSSGSPSPLDINLACNELEQIHKERKLSDLHVVWDVRQIKNPSIRVRKGIIQLNNRLSKYWESRYLIVSPKYKTLVRIYKFIYQYKIENLYFADSINDAITAILFPSASEKEDEAVTNWTEVNRKKSSWKKQGGVGGNN